MTVAAQIKKLNKDLRFAKGILAGRPFNILLQVTHRCMMRCRFCGFWSRSDPPDHELTLAEYRRVEQELSELGCFLISIEGGEPLLRPDIVDLVRLFSRRHICLLYTNGWLVEADLARDLFRAGVSQVGVSIDFPDAASHDAARGCKGAHDRAFRAVRLLREAAPLGGRQVHVMTLLAAQTLPGLEPLLVRSARLGVGHAVTLLSMAGPGRAPGLTPLHPPVSDYLIRLFRKYPHFKTFHGYLEAMDRFLSQDQGLAAGLDPGSVQRGQGFALDLPVCRAGQQSFNLGPSGLLAPCIEFMDRPVGSIRTAPLAHLFEAAARAPEVASCQRCWSLCRGFPQMLAGRPDLHALMDLATRL